MSRDFQDLITEAAAAPIDGWDFTWLKGRAEEQRPSWGYQRRMGEHMSRARVALDLQTGGGEVLAGVPHLAPVTIATEGWKPNVARAIQRLRPRGVAVVAHDDRTPLPFAARSFELIVSRHPVQTQWEEIARTLSPGGTYFSQQVGPASVFELVEYFLGPQPEEIRGRRHPEDARAAAVAAGLDVVDLRFERLRTTFFDIGAVVYFLRKVIWLVPGFSVERYRPTLLRLHQHIEREGAFVAHATRFLIEARRPR